MKLFGLDIMMMAVAMVVLPAIGLQASEPPKMKMTTPIPEGIATPDRLETHLGTLVSFDGVPDAATTKKV